MTGPPCPHCGAPIAPEALFCMKCGADVSGQRPGIATRVAGEGNRADAGAITTRISQAGMLSRLRDATLGEYEILAELGRGGMATVYLAHDIQLDRKVAIKVLNPRVAEGEGMVERFRLEARTAASLSHPHIIPIHAVRETENLVFFVMKFVVGRPLDAIIKASAPLPIPMVRTILTRVADALGYAHRSGVIHRDVKPANIMIDAEGMPIVTDFGIAKVADRHGLTLTGAALGTPTYMSPEQCNADKITGASDQYSLGVVAFEMLVGRPLYEGESVVTIMFKHVHDPPPVPEAFGPAVPADLAAAVIRMLQKSPAQRWSTMEEVLPVLRGRDVSQEDQARTQLVELARDGGNATLLARLSTPRSPISVRAQRSRAAGGTAAAPGEAAAAPAPRRRRAWPVAAAVLVLAGAGAAAVLRPWQSDQTAPGDTVAVTMAPGVVPESLPNPPADSVIPPPAAAAVTEAAPTAAPPIVQAVRIVDAPASVAEGQTVTLRATVVDRDGRAVPRSVRWTSSDPEVVVMQAGGQLSAIAPGRATVTAEADGRRAQATVTVTPVVTSVAVSPVAAELRTGESVSLSAAAFGPGGRPVTGPQVVWRSSNERVAVVSTVGRVTAVGAGAAVISAAAGGQVGTAQIAVTAPPAAAAQPPAAEPPAPAVTEDPRQAITDVVAAYARALQAKDLTRVRALYPGMTQATERSTRNALEAMEDLRVSLTPAQINVDGSNARVVVTGEWTYRGGRLDVRNRYDLERRTSGWVIVHIE